jgi:DnaK suppressor protein
MDLALTRTPARHSITGLWCGCSAVSRADAPVSPPHPRNAIVETQRKQGTVGRLWTRDVWRVAVSKRNGAGRAASNHRGGNNRPASANKSARGSNSRKPTIRLGPGRGRESAGEPDAAPAAVPQTHLTPEELDAFRILLLQKRTELVGDMDHLEQEALHRNRSDASGDLSMMPIHMADIGTDNYEQEFTIGLLEGEKQLVKEIDAAIERIKKGTYGVCEATHKPIAKARLKARPWARHCLAYTREQEANRRR